MKKLLFSRDSECIQPILALMEGQTRRTLVAWALDSARPMLAFFEQRRPNEPRPAIALETGYAWARGDCKMPYARQTILDAHRAAAEAQDDPAAQAAARAVAHAASTIHVAAHAPGLMLYGLTALVYGTPPEEAEQIVQAQCNWYLSQLEYWIQHTDEFLDTWAPFMLRGQPRYHSKP